MNKKPFVHIFIIISLTFTSLAFFPQALAHFPIKCCGYGPNPPVVEFPAYFYNLSPVINCLEHNHFEESKFMQHGGVLRLKKMSAHTLDDLRNCVNSLEKAARTTDGTTIPLLKNYKNPIFVHSLVEKVLHRSLKNFTDRRLAKLFKAVHYLQIEPLIDALSTEIARRILLDKSDETMKQWSFLPDQENGIQEILFLLEHGYKKKTIADYLGEHGQPYSNGTINLSKTGLTHLQGIDLLEQKNKTVSLLLNDNFILDPSLTITSPKKPFHEFSQLKYLNLSKNYLTSLPRIWTSLDLEQLDLHNNRIKQMDYKTIPLPNLKVLCLSGNEIQSFEKGVFHQLPQLQKLSLSYNQLSCVPSDIQSLTHLQTLSLEGNKIKALEEDTFKLCSKLHSLNICNNPLEVIEEKLFTPLQSLQHLFFDQDHKRLLHPSHLTDLKETVFLYHDPKEIITKKRGLQ